MATAKVSAAPCFIINLANSTNLTFYGRTIVQADRAIKVRVIITNNFGIVLAEAFTLYGFR